MGSVWEGIHSTLGTRVAVKFIDAEHAASAEARRRFENEARAAATLRSKHVVGVYDHGMMDDGRPFIVMEFLEGEPLDRRLDRAVRLPARDTARLVSMICRALAKAHAAGIVHRDLKPDNVFLVWDDEDGSDVAKVVDFGIAKFTDSQGPASATRTGSVLGTPYYMSPEQARGLRAVDHRSDLWSVGVMTYRCITGRLPFEGEAVGDVLVRLCTAPLPVPSEVAPDVPPGFDAWFARALAREPDARFQTAAELATSLALVCGLSVQAHRPGDSTGGSSPNIQVRISAGVTPGVPLAPLDITTPSADIVRAPQITGAPITQTPAPSRARPHRGGLVLGAVATLIVLAIGAGVITKLLQKGDVAPLPEAAARPAEVQAAPVIPSALPNEPSPPTPPEPSPPPAVSAGPDPISKPSAIEAAPTKRAAPRFTGKPAPPPRKAPAPETPANDIGF
jgi:serine/threonine-protein kinase